MVGQKTNFSSSSFTGMDKNQDPGYGIHIPDPQHWNILYIGRRYGTLTGWPGGQCSLYQDLTSGTSMLRRVRPERRLKGRGAHSSAIPLAVWSVYSGDSCRNGQTCNTQHRYFSLKGLLSKLPLIKQEKGFSSSYRHRCERKETGYVKSRRAPFRVGKNPGFFKKKPAQWCITASGS
jgi:hypothetical protein